MSNNKIIKIKNRDLINIAREVLDIEIEGIKFVKDNLDDNFLFAIKNIIETKGRVIVCGMGKSGIVAKKIAATFASTGTPSFFMHPAEAFHGDLGMVKSEDIFIAISNSGETDEILRIVPFLLDNGNFIISLTGNKNSTLAKKSHCNIDIAIPKEACPLQLAPTTSTTATMAIGDALAIVLMHKKDFKSETFAKFHPGGSLGRRLLNKVFDEMINIKPFVKASDSIIKVLESMSNFGLGLVLIEDNNYSIITDGDLRRAIEKYQESLFSLTAKDIATNDPISISPHASMQSAYEIMDSKNISSLIVEDNDKFLGILKK